MNKLKTIRKKYQKLSLLLINTFVYLFERNKFSIKQKDGKKFEINNKLIALNILYVPYNSEEIRHAHISKHNPTRENQLILLMITDNEKWHYLAVKKLSTLFSKIISMHNGDFYYLNCLDSFRNVNNFKEHKNV